MKAAKMNSYKSHSEDEDLDDVQSQWSSVSATTMANGKAQPAKQSSFSSNPPSGHIGMGNVIRVMNQLYDVFNRLKSEGHHDINLPEIVVCGSQSSGKTSVLESITGDEFLPRGIDIQTRCPIVLQLVHTNGTQRWVEFLHDRNRRYTDMKEVKRVIEELNMKIKSANLVISEEPITLRIHSPDVVDLTLVDLPGLVENAVDGQPADLRDKILNLVQKYIKNPNSIILAVSAATNDIADSKCIRMAKEVDPAGNRTLGVLTKLDLMDEGTDASEVLLGKKISLKLGIIGVVNRSYKETQEGKTVQEGQRKEREFLERNYPILAGRNGTPYLVNRISDLLLKRISETLPNVKARIEQLIGQYSRRLALLGDVEEENEKREMFVKHLTNFYDKYCGQVDGRRRNLDTHQLCTSARINQIFQYTFGPEFDKLVAGGDLTDREIDFAVFNSHALHSMQWLSDDAFQEFAKREILKMKPLIIHCARMVYEQMLNAIQTSADSDASSKYPKLNNNIALVVSDLINLRFESCKGYLDDYLDAEASIAKTSKPEFLAKLQKLSSLPGATSTSSAAAAPSESSATTRSVTREDSESTHGSDTGNPFGSSENISVYGERDVELTNSKIHRANVRELINCYFEMMKRDVKDHIPKAITFKLVYGVVDTMNNVLTLRLNTRENVEELMQESETLIKERCATNEMLKVYRDAKQIIDVILQTAQV